MASCMLTTTRKNKYVKIGCVTKPEDLLAIGIQVDYDVLGLTIVYMHG